MTHLNCKTVGQRDFHGFWNFACNLATIERNSLSRTPKTECVFTPQNRVCFHTPNQSVFRLFFASSNVSSGLIREALHRFNGWAKIWSAPGIVGKLKIPFTAMPFFRKKSLRIPIFPTWAYKSDAHPTRSCLIVCIWVHWILAKKFI